MAAAWLFDANVFDESIFDVNEFFECIFDAAIFDLNVFDGCKPGGGSWKGRAGYGFMPERVNRRDDDEVLILCLL